MSIKYRSISGAITNSAYCVCGIVFILIYKYLNSWKITFLIASAMTLMCAILIFKFTHESSRFYLIKNNPNRFIENLRKISIINGFDRRFETHVVNSYFDENEKVLTNIRARIYTDCSATDQINSDFNEDFQFEFLNFQEIVKSFKENSKKRENCEKNEKDKFGFWSLLKYPSQRATFLIMNLIWFTVAGLYYGLALNVKNLPGDIYWNGILLYSVEGISYLISGSIINIEFFGRKRSMLIMLFLSLIIYALLAFGQIENSSEQVVLALLARVTIATVFNIIYTYSAEVYPSVIKSFGFGFNSVCSRLAGIVVPLLIEILGKTTMNIIFMIFNFMIFLLTMFLKETYGKPLMMMIPEEKNNSE